MPRCSLPVRCDQGQRATAGSSGQTLPLHPSLTHLMSISRRPSPWSTVMVCTASRASSCSGEQCAARAQGSCKGSLALKHHPASSMLAGGSVQAPLLGWFASCCWAATSRMLRLGKQCGTAGTSRSYSAGRLPAPRPRHPLPTAMSDPKRMVNLVPMQLFTMLSICCRSFVSMGKEISSTIFTASSSART